MLWVMSLLEGENLLREDKKNQRAMMGGMREICNTIMKIMIFMPAGFNVMDEM